MSSIPYLSQRPRRVTSRWRHLDQEAWPRPVLATTHPSRGGVGLASSWTARLLGQRNGRRAQESARRSGDREGGSWCSWKARPGGGWGRDRRAGRDGPRGICEAGLVIRPRPWGVGADVVWPCTSHLSRDSRRVTPSPAIYQELSNRWSVARPGSPWSRPVGPGLPHRQRSPLESGAPGHLASLVLHTSTPSETSPGPSRWTDANVSGQVAAGVASGIPARHEWARSGQVTESRGARLGVSAAQSRRSRRLSSRPCRNDGPHSRSGPDCGCNDPRMSRQVLDGCWSIDPYTPSRYTSSSQGAGTAARAGTATATPAAMGMATPVRRVTPSGTLRPDRQSR